MKFSTCTGEYPHGAVPASGRRLESLAHGEFSGATLQMLADRPGLSYHRTSHFFSEALGIPLKS
jgi:hypothetical protein